MRNCLTGCALLVMVFSAYAAWVPSVGAALVRGGEFYQLADNTLLDDDLYFAGNTLKLHGTTTGDVVAVGSYLAALGDVQGDLFLVAGRVTATGTRISGDARLIGGVVTVGSEIDEDLIILGGEVIITKDAVIHGDLLVYGDRVVLQGVVEGVVQSHVRTMALTGRVDHDVDVSARESFSVSADAVVGGDLRYSAPRQAFISDTVTISGERIFTKRGMSETVNGFLTLSVLLRLCMAVVAAVLLVWLFPRFSTYVVGRALGDSLWMLVKGFVFVFALPVIAVGCIVTLVGIVPGVMLVLFYGTAMMLTLPLTAVVAGVLLARWLKKGEGLEPTWAALGAISLVLIMEVPILGLLLRALLLFLTFGTLCVLAYEQVWLTRKNAPVTRHEETDTTTSSPGKKSK